MLKQPKTRVMKTISFLLALLVTTYSFANSPDKTAMQLMSQKVQAALVMPESLKEQGKAQTISIWFTVDENGNVTDVTANTKNKEAKADLEKQFRQLNFKGLKPSVYNGIDVSFVVS
jgi:hypothetical protein